MPDATHPGCEPKTAHMHPLFGLAPGGVYRAGSVTRSPVGSYPTLSPLPLYKGRSALCGTFPRFTPGGHYPPPCLYGARTFLQTRITPCPATARPSDRKCFYPRFVCLPRNLVQPARTASRHDFVSIVSDLQHRQSRSLGCTRDIIFKQSPLQ